MSNLETALALAGAGLFVFPCTGADGDAGKVPPAGFGWKGESSTDADKIRRWFMRWPGATVALDLGKSGLFVVDCDKPDNADQLDGQEYFESVILTAGADSFPFVTSLTPSKGVHYLFRQPDGEPLGNGRGGLPKKRDVAIDVRGRGGYIIAPGATMQDGRAYVLSGNIADIPATPDWLLAIMRTVATDEPVAAPVTLPVVSFPPSTERVGAYSRAGFDAEIAEVRTAPKGTRNDTLNTSAFKIGTMVGAGWVSESEAYSALVGAVTGFTDQKKTLDTLKRGLREGMGHPRPALADESTPNLVAPLLARLETGELYNPQTGEVVEGPALLARPVDGFPPGLVGEIGRWIVASARKPQPLLALGAALTIVGTVLGRKIAGPTLSGTHMYIIGLAETGTGKDHPLASCTAILEAAGLDLLVGGSEFISMPAVINAIQRQPCSLWPMDEFGSYLARVNSRGASGFESSISGMLRKMWGSSFKSVKTPEWANRPSERIFAPALSIFGASTHKEFYDAMSGGDVTNGVLNRILIFSVDKSPPAREPLVSPWEVPETIIAQLKQLDLIQGVVSASAMSSNIKPKPLSIGWGAGAGELFAENEAEVERRGEANLDHKPFLARVCEYAARMATIIAVGRGAGMVELADLQFALDVSWRSVADMIVGADDYMADTDNQANAKMMLRKLKERPDGLGPEALSRAMDNRLKINEYKGLLAQLLSDGQIVQDTTTRIYRLGA